jgi:uncharacterized protein with gpF-like domain
VGISLAVTIGDVAGAIELTLPQEAALSTGGLDESQVYYEYVTQHDTHVRPSHAALNGTVWKLGDAFAPVPPLDYGCRCYLSYRGKPGTIAARLLPEAASEPTTKSAAYATHLDKEVRGWREIAKDTAKLGASERTSAIVSALRDRGIADARDLSMMIIEASREP